MQGLTCLTNYRGNTMHRSYDIRAHGIGKTVRRVVKINDEKGKVLIIGRELLPKDNPYRQGAEYVGSKTNGWEVRALGFAGLLD